MNTSDTIAKLVEYAGGILIGKPQDGKYAYFAGTAQPRQVPMGDHGNAMSTNHQSVGGSVTEVLEKLLEQIEAVNAIAKEPRRLAIVDPAGKINN